MDRDHINDHVHRMSYSINKDDLLLMVLAVFIPPVAVWKRKGIFNRDTLLNVLLFLLLFFPAIIHACYVVYETSSERSYDLSRRHATAPAVDRDLEAHPAEESQAQPPAYDEDDEAGADVPLMDNKQQLSSGRT
ncbi:CDA_G0028260.mRNA.1.CDS.1 [Saccharomyces cerevisiae]|nr:CDA_G0028260.mRNA.1.CDS.1 [Saccharomyces cerevisiae]CAI7348908.1 CDA_G0028260.mRNA.1.CDS.1 [Saccharomyces cerevisiae]